MPAAASTATGIVLTFPGKADGGSTKGAASTRLPLLFSSAVCYQDPETPSLIRVRFVSLWIGVNEMVPLPLSLMLPSRR
jgi:hypothetical protein